MFIKLKEKMICTSKIVNIHADSSMYADIHSAKKIRLIIDFFTVFVTTRIYRQIADSGKVGVIKCIFRSQFVQSRQKEDNLYDVDTFVGNIVCLSHLSSASFQCNLLCEKFGETCWTIISQRAVLFVGKNDPTQCRRVAKRGGLPHSGQCL